MLERARAMQGQLTEWRRDFHRHPELGFKELRTANRVAEVMESLGCRVQRGVGRTGVVADLAGAPGQVQESLAERDDPGFSLPLVAIRADMDALPIQEYNDVDYASQTPGVMHACGHDAHLAMALGAATLLQPEIFSGTVRFLFQPSEEANDEGGHSGAFRMIEDGAMQDVEMILALHVDPSTEVGIIRLETGPASGGVDSFFARVIGKGGHGARPFETVDPFYLSAYVILALNGIASRRLDPFDPAVISIGSLHGGQAENVIPRTVTFSGTLRFTDAKVQKQIHAEIKQAFEITRPLGGNYELKFTIGTPPVLNHPAAVELLRQAASDLLGGEHILPFEKELGAEDFSCFTEMVPGAMFYLGCRIKGDERIGHNRRFDINEDALPVGAALLAEAALRFLKKRNQPQRIPRKLKETSRK